MSSNTVHLYIYDLSRGLAATLSPVIIGKKIDGIWHTSIVVYNREYFFGSGGVESCNPASTALGQPLQKLELGETQVSYSVFIDYVNGLSESSYAGATYDLFKHNCNNFSEDIAQFLCGVSIPKYILDLPNEVISSSLGQALPLLIKQLEKSARPIAEEQQRETSPDFEQLNSQIEEARYNSFLLDERRKTLKEKIAKKERKKEKKRRKQLQSTNSIGPFPVELEELVPSEVKMAEAETINNNVAGNNSNNESSTSTDVFELEEQEKREEEEKKKSREPPIVYKDIFDAKIEFDGLLSLVDGKLSESEKNSMEELQLYMIGDEGSWALSDNFLNFIGRLLHDREFNSDVKIKIINLLAIAALKDDVILLLHQDRKDHFLMNYAFDIDKMPTDEQEAIALFIANMFENLSSSEWLMYISEWTYNSQQISNIRVSTKVAVHSLLSDLPSLQDKGAAIIHNLACKEVKSVVFDDVAVELTMAVLQYFNSNPSEEQLFRCLKALSRFIQVSAQEVPQLIQMIGPDPRKFKGSSDRIDTLIDQMNSKLR